MHLEADTFSFLSIQSMLALMELHSEVKIGLGTRILADQHLNVMPVEVCSSRIKFI